MSTLKSYDLFGFPEACLESVRETVESALGVVFELRDSSYVGVYFRCETVVGDELILQKNQDDSSDDWAEDAFRQFPTLLYTVVSNQPDVIRNAVGAIGGQLLRRQLL